jgi:hypothetical protein
MRSGGRYHTTNAVSTALLNQCLIALQQKERAQSVLLAHMTSLSQLMSFGEFSHGPARPSEAAAHGRFR